MFNTVLTFNIIFESSFRDYILIFSFLRNLLYVLKFSPFHHTLIILIFPRINQHTILFVPSQPHSSNNIYLHIISNAYFMYIWHIISTYIFVSPNTHAQFVQSSSTPNRLKCVISVALMMFNVIIKFLLGRL